MDHIKVGMLAPEFLPVWGGVGSYIVELVRHLPKDIQVHVYTPFRYRLGKYKISSSEYEYSRFFGKNIHVHFISKAYDTFFYNANFQFAVMRKIPELIKQEKIDILHSHTAHMPDILLQFRKVETPTVTTIHTTIKGQREGTKKSRLGFWELEHSERITLLSYPILKFIEDFYFIKKRYYITVSQWMKEQLKNMYPRLSKQEIIVIHNAVDTKLFSPSRTSKKQNNLFDKKIVLFTGRLIAAKGVDVLIKSIPQIIKEYKEAYFIFIGPGDPTPYKRKLERLNIPATRYKFLGYLKNKEELVEYYNSASVFVAPTFYENLPIRILEAMSCGTPVVATNVCAIPEAIDHMKNGILINPGSIKQLVQGITYILENDDIRKKMGHEARLKVLKKFDWKIAANKIVKVYKQILLNN